MARARNIKPGFFRNADLVELPAFTRLLFAGLWTLADRAGRLEDRPKQIKMDIFPADDVDVNAALAELSQAGMLQRYDIEGKRCLQITNFAKHQNPHRDEKASILPPPPGTEPEPAATAAPAPTPVPTIPKHRASTVPAPCATSAASVAIGLNPESLSPDSLQPESNTLTAATSPQAVCVLLQADGIQGPDPADPELAVLLQAGADTAVFRAAAQTAVTKGSPRFGYVLGIVRNKMQQAAAVAATALALPVAMAPAHAMRVDMSRVTTPSRAGPDPELVRIERERNSLKPMPPEMRAQLKGRHHAAAGQ
jgi:hypothetical protein